mmetsp:Transcript_44225/g.144909  ORF Transcript_44225/g.144909 Transcript_44225/m.144909 type:complete len:236 (+) Transcript_44225:2621-3328(+)
MLNGGPCSAVRSYSHYVLVYAVFILHSITIVRLRAHLRLAERGGVDVVSLLNVLDRCDAPRALLRDAAALLRPGGRLLLALRLPLDCFVLGRSDRPRRPREGLLQPAVAPASWAEAAGALVAGVTAREGLTLEAFAQAPEPRGGVSSCRPTSAREDTDWRPLPRAVTSEPTPRTHTVISWCVCIPCRCRTSARAIAATRASTRWTTLSASSASRAEVGVGCPRVAQFPHRPASNP